MAKKKKKKASLSPSLFKLTGARAKLKIIDKKQATYYFATKIKPEKAAKMARSDGAEILGVSPSDVTVGKPALKYDFYSTYSAELELKFLRPRMQEIGVNDEVAGVLVGKEVEMPTKGKEIPGKSIKITMVELFTINRTDSLVLDGVTGAPARSLEKMLKGPGKKRASPAWIKKAKVTPGKYNSIAKVVKGVAKMAGKVPKEAKRVVEHTLTFTKLIGFYVPTYYVKVSAGENSRVMRINAVNGNVAIKL
ncbi:MAG: hypothetical protein K9W43_03605 [Candidatus Thorarchaeota archaeon]|nr:hypothetical protein [Candidatus Thorarchaeota archaeon]